MSMEILFVEKRNFPGNIKQFFIEIYKKHEFIYKKRTHKESFFKQQYYYSTFFAMS